jgi:hypothetical protein
MRRAFFIAAGAVAALLLADVATTYYALHHGGTELNPIARFIISGGILWLLVAKMGLICNAVRRAAFTTPRYAHFRPNNFVLDALVCTGLAGCYLFVVISNLLSILAAR